MTESTATGSAEYSPLKGSPGYGSLHQAVSPEDRGAPERRDRLGVADQ
jgi:hypothetical protein